MFEINLNNIDITFIQGNLTLWMFFFCRKRFYFSDFLQYQPSEVEEISV